MVATWEECCDKGKHWNWEKGVAAKVQESISAVGHIGSEKSTELECEMEQQGKDLAEELDVDVRRQQGGWWGFRW